MTAAPRLSICEFTTLTASFEEDVAAYAGAGVGGIGVCELKLEGVADPAALVREAGLKVTHCVPAVPSILPLPLMPGPTDVEERVGALCESVWRLAGLEADCVLFLTGPGEERRLEVVEGIRRVAEEARRAGVRLALEPIHPSQRDELSFVRTIGEAAALLEEAGAREAGILLDTWHVWDQPGRDDEIREFGDRIFGVHVADRREPTRSGFDRVLPGDGVIDLPGLLGVVAAVGYEGFYDLELFSDNGSFGDHWHDSLWDVPAPELARRGRVSLERVVPG